MRVRVNRRRTLTALACLTVTLPLIPAPAAADPVTGSDVLYTSDADFDSGVLTDVNHDAPNGDQLQLDRTNTFFPYVNVAASARGTMVRIDVDTGEIVGEWRSAPDGRGRNPSRTTVDRLGNTWLSNRDEAAGGQGSVTRVGVIVGGTRVDAAGAPDPGGDFLVGPFSYNTCQDRDADGKYATSRGLGDIRPWTNAGGVDNDGGVETAADECVITYTRVAGNNTRTVAVDAQNDLWTGGSDTQHEKLDGDTGQVVPGTQFALGCGGYGGLIDPAGTLWSARYGANLLRYETGSGTGACLGTDRGDYGLGLDPDTGELWHTSLGGNRVAKLAPDGTVLGVFPHGNNSAQGVAVDADGNVWVAHSLNGATTVGHLRTDGTYVGTVALPGGNGPTGVAVDSNGKVWVANFNSNNAQRIDPDAGPIGGGGFPVGAVDLTVDLGAGAGPYNYSDMTGSVLGEVTAPVGTWSVVQDGGFAGTSWGTVTWNTEAQGSEPAGTSITVEARTADTEAGLAAQPFAAVGNGAPFTASGRFIEVRSTLRANSSGDSPVLSDLRVETAERGGVFSCQATALNLAGIVVARANPPDVPCVDDHEQVANANLNAGVLTVRASALTATTEQEPDDLLEPPAPGDASTATARVEHTRISTLLVTIEVGVIDATASATCVEGPDGLEPEFTGSSQIASLKINGVAVAVGSAPLTIPLVIGTLSLNSQTVSGGTIVQRALALDTVLTDVVIGEAKANVEGKQETPSGTPCR
jgi:DNA-binding beta-propeller fold protein YncE